MAFAQQCKVPHHTVNPAMVSRLLATTLVRVGGQLIAVFDKQLLPTESREKLRVIRAALDGSGIDHWVVVEKMLAARAEVLELESLAERSSDFLHLHVVAAMVALSNNVQGQHRVFHHLASGLWVRANIATNPTQSLATLVTYQCLRSAAMSVEPQQKIGSAAVDISIITADQMLLEPKGVSLLVVVRRESLASAANGKTLVSGSATVHRKSLLSSAALTPVEALTALKHIAQNLQLPMPSVGLVVLYSHAEADIATQAWRCGDKPTDKNALLSESLPLSWLLALGELAVLPGTVIQTMIRGLPGVATRVAADGSGAASSITEVLAEPVQIYVAGKVFAGTVGQTLVARVVMRGDLLCQPH